MKKIYSLLFMGGVALTANAQQINGSFDGEWVKCVPWDSKGNTTAVGTRPEGWNISNVALGNIKLGSETVGSDGTGKAVKLVNKNLFGNGIPGYLTLGTPFATAEGVTANNADGGTFGGAALAYHPDAISFDYKRDNSKNASEPATVVAYLWSGTWTQKDVPGNTVISGSATKVDMTDRDRNVLDMPTSTGGDVSATDNAKLVAQLTGKITEDSGDEWQSMTVPFDYGANDATTPVEKINVIFSATDYFGDRKSIVQDNSLTVDNVKLVYYHGLSSLTAYNQYGGVADIGFAPDVYEYNVNSQYDSYKTKVLFTKLGVGATATGAYDPATARYTITVKGEDYDETTNPDAMSVYTLQYTKPTPTLSSLCVGGHEFFKPYSSDKDFSASGVYCPDEIAYTASSPYAVVEPSYDEETGVLTVTVSEDGATGSSVYTIAFEGKSKEPVYQIPNSGFETYSYTTGFTGSWNSYGNAIGPWSSISAGNWPKLKRTPKADSYEGRSLRLASADAYTSYVSGSATTGFWFISSDTPTDATNYIFTDRTDVDGNLPFAGRPDAFEVYAKFTPGTAKDADTTPQGSVRLVIHGEAPYRLPETDDYAASKIGEASVLIPATDVWTKFTGNFEYVGEKADRQYMLAAISTSQNMGDSKDDVLDVDNLKLIYYSTLSDLTFKGATLKDFSPEKTEYTVDGDINADAGALAYTAKGAGAECVVAYDKAEGVATVTVNGGDTAVNPDNKTVYTVKFKPTATGIGSVSADSNSAKSAYTIGGVRVDASHAKGLLVVDGKKTVLK